ncbi:TIGR01841 family phasin [Pseudothauera rhizosphaerae]|uniref:Phasin family protein n=1 Tax=Pseudothauera rhizosphaerae TaxID=2565932 RepID=A0A4S4AY89_9RHOO|nr:TIGR01841 family phasin [Pseudothauera rhizosphaerae]THF64298.1 phasin family protein [Pseudothauera rhizosphaerae]
MTITPEKIAASNKVAVESLLNVSATALSSAERLAALNLNTARSLIEDSLANLKALAEAKDPQAFAALQGSFVQPGTEKLVAYYRGVYEIATQNQEEITKLLETQFAELNKNLNTALDDAAKSAPAGSDIAISAVKSALAAANSTYDSVSKAARQVVDIAEANVTTATNAAVKAVGSTAKAARKSA